MQISPKVAVWINVIYLILTGITAPMLQQAGVANAAQVAAWAAIIAAPLNILMHAVSSTAPGPLAPQDATAAPPVQKPASPSA